MVLKVIRPALRARFRIASLAFALVSGTALTAKGPIRRLIQQIPAA